jgi:hypothetical protein
MDYQPDGLPPPLEGINTLNAPVQVFSSVTALYHTTSDPSSHGLQREHMQCCCGSAIHGPQSDCVLVEVDPKKSPGGLQAAHLKLIFLFEYRNKPFNCALVHWYSEGQNCSSDLAQKM